MAKRSKEEEGEEGYSHSGSAEEDSPPPPKKSKKSEKSSEKKPEKKSAKTKVSTKESSPSGSSKKGSVAKVSYFESFRSPRPFFTNSDGEKFVDLGKKRRVTVRSFKGSVLVDIREFYGKDDDLQPGKKGISLSPEQWAELKANGGTIDGLVKKLQT
ncbi:hypothetical protein ACEPAG_7929 [Sanghuangporus baumii]